ncbi:MAG: translation initiation factor IF-3 [Solirubrobacteraceae bacterium]
MPEVRLVGEDGKQIGVVKTSDALVYAQERDLDLVEVAPEARPPVCRVLDYSKYKYEQAQKLKAARKHQQQITIREIKFRPKIAQNDYDTKKGHVTRFLLGKDKVKITIMFRGREVTHPERGTALLDKLATELAEIAVIEQSPLQDGRNMTMMLAPSKSVLAAAEQKEKDAAAAKVQHSSHGPETEESGEPSASNGEPPILDAEPTAAADDAEPTAAVEAEPAAAEAELAGAEAEPAAAEAEPTAAEAEPAASNGDRAAKATAQAAPEPTAEPSD